LRWVFLETAVRGVVEDVEWRRVETSLERERVVMLDTLRLIFGRGSTDDGEGWLMIGGEGGRDEGAISEGILGDVSFSIGRYWGSLSESESREYSDSMSEYSSSESRSGIS